MSSVPELHTNRLILKELTPDHAVDYEKHFVDYEVIRYLSDAVPWPYPKGGVETFIRETIVPHQGNGRWVWGIFLKDDLRELIGCVDLWKVGKPENRGFWLGRKYHGKGIMTEACFRVNDFAFFELGFEKLIFANAIGNTASRRVKEKTGCSFIEVRPAQFVDPALTKHEIWELRKEDWLLYRRKKAVK